MSTKSQFELTCARAQKIYEERMRTGAPGNQESDWLQAEREVTAELKKSAKKSVSVAAPAAKVAAPAPEAAKKKPGRKPKAETAAAAPAKKTAAKKKKK